MLPENARIFENSFAGAIFLLLGGPAGGEALERAKPFPGLSPRQGRQNARNPSQTSLFLKFRSFWRPCRGLSAGKGFAPLGEFTT